MQATYDDSAPIIRSMFRNHSFTVTVQVETGSILSVPALTNAFTNYKVDYSFHTAAVTTDTVFSAATVYTSLVDFESSQRGATTSVTNALKVTISQSMESNICLTITHICFSVKPTADGTFTDTLPNNNVVCSDISDYILCNPGKSLIQVSDCFILKLLKVFYGYDCA